MSVPIAQLFTNEKTLSRSTSALRFNSEFPHEVRERLRQFVLLCLCSWVIHLLGYSCIHLIDGHGEVSLQESPTRLATAIGFVVWTIAMIFLIIAGSRELLPRRRAMLGVFSLIPTAALVLCYVGYFLCEAAYHVIVAIFHVAPVVF